MRANEIEFYSYADQRQGLPPPVSYVDLHQMQLLIELYVLIFKRYATTPKTRITSC